MSCKTCAAKKVVTHLLNQGRLGNQLFQIAAVYSHALRHSLTPVIPEWEYYSHFNLNIAQKPFGVLKNVGKEYRENGFQYQFIPDYKNMRINGYFQSYKYFEGYEDIIRWSFSPKQPKFSTNPDTTSVHFRRGDYLTANCQYALPIEYYYKAIEVLKPTKLLVFTDDVNWVKANFEPGIHVEYSEGYNNVDDLERMSRCGSHIIANSTFSWWGAWLSGSKNVIAPAKWFIGNCAQHETKDLYLPNWIKI